MCVSVVEKTSRAHSRTTTAVYLQIPLLCIPGSILIIGTRHSVPGKIMRTYGTTRDRRAREGWRRPYDPRAACSSSAAALVAMSICQAV